MSARLGPACLATLVAVLSVTTACQALRQTFAPDASGYTEAQLREDLAAFASEFAVMVGSTALEIADHSTSRGVRRTTLIWRVSMAPLVQEAAFLDDPQEAFASVLTYTVMMRHYFTDGDGRDLFGSEQPKAVAAARQLEASALDIGTRFLDEKQLAQLMPQVEDVVSRYPIRGKYFSVESRRSLARNPEIANVFEWLVNIPMSPIAALQGVGETAAAVREFSDTARAFSHVVATLPQQARLQTELLLYDIENRDTMMQGISAFEQLADSTQRASRAIERLPADLGTIVAGATGPLTEAKDLLAQARTLAEALAPVSEELRQGSASWERILVREKKPQDGRGHEPKRRPFDVTEWESAAREIGVAAVQLRGLADQWNTMLDERHLQVALSGVKRTVQTAKTEARALVDAAFWRGLQLLLALFGLLLVYRIAAARLARPSRVPPP